MHAAGNAPDFESPYTYVPGAARAPAAPWRAPVAVGAALSALVALTALACGAYVGRVSATTHAALERVERHSERLEAALVAALAVQRSAPHELAVQPGVVDPYVHKRAVAHVTPRKLQLERGGCWAFAAVGLLEHSYRLQGVSRGWLHEAEFLRLSEQAFGVSVLDACRAAPAACVFDGDEIWTGNSTEGGEVPVLYYLKALAADAALPHSVCPYTPTAGRDRHCPGRDAALAVSPLRFEVRSMRTYYERLDIKSALRSSGRALGLSTSMAVLDYYVPCTAASAAILRCGLNDAARCVACPSVDAAYGGVGAAGGCCTVATRPMNNMHGEFFFLQDHSPPRLEGGHAMLIVGYSDTYVTREGEVGGFILRNSWWDGMPPSATWTSARGSHSMAFFMQTISDADEAELCPNVHSASSWYPCADLATCTRTDTAMYAKVARKALRLRCLGPSAGNTLHGLCEEDEPLYLKNLTYWGRYLSVACFLGPSRAGADAVAGGAKSITRRLAEGSGGAHGTHVGHGAPSAEFCTPPVPTDDLSMSFAPAEDEARQNSEDACGFYFFPYALLEELDGKFGGFFVTDVDIAWADEAYAANAKGDSGLNYSLVRANTHTQGAANFTGPFPNLFQPL